MAHAWKACWVQALGGSNPPSSATEPRDRFRFRGFCCLWRRVLWVPLVFRAPSGPAAREIATRELRSEWSISKPARALRSLRRPPHRRRLVADVWLGALTRCPARLRRRPRPPQPGPLTPFTPAVQPEFAIELVACGSAVVPGAVGPGRPRDRHTRACGSEVSISKPARALRTLRRPPHSGAWSLMCGSARRLEARPGPSAAHRHRGQVMQPLPPSLGVLWWPAIGRSRAAEPRPRSP